METGKVKESEKVRKISLVSEKKYWPFFLFSFFFKHKSYFYPIVYILQGM